MPVNCPIDTCKLFFKKNISIVPFDTGKASVIGLLKCIACAHHLVRCYDRLVRNPRLCLQFIPYINFHLIFLLHLSEHKKTAGLYSAAKCFAYCKFQRDISCRTDATVFQEAISIPKLPRGPSLQSSKTLYGSGKISDGRSSSAIQSMLRGNSPSLSKNSFTALRPFSNGTNNPIDKGVR